MRVGLLCVVVACVGACDDRARDRTSKGGEDMIGFVGLHDCVNQDTLNALECWDKPRTTCSQVGSSCDDVIRASPTAEIHECLDRTGSALTRNAPDARDCLAMADESAMLRAYRDCGQSWDPAEWVLDESALYSYLSTYCWD